MRRRWAPNSVSQGEVLAHGWACDWSFDSTPTMGDVQETFRRTRDSAPSPDGVGYSAWKSGGSCAVDASWRPCLTAVAWIGSTRRFTSRSKAGCGR